jgi:hypothetical protein
MARLIVPKPSRIMPSMVASRSARRGGFPWRTASASLLLSVLVPLLLLIVASPDLALNTSETWLTVLLIVYSGTHLALRFGSGNLRIVSTIFWLFVYVAMSVASLARITTGLHDHLVVDPSSLTEAVLITLAGCIAYDVAQLVYQRLPHPTEPGASMRRIQFGRLNVIGVLGIVASTYYIYTIGLSTFFSSRDALTQRVVQLGLTAGGSQSAAAILGSLGTVPLLIAWLGWTARLSRDPVARRAPSSWLWYLTLSAFMLIVNNPISNSRYQFLTVALAALFCLPRLGKRGMRLAIGGGVFLSIVVFPYSDYFRSDTAYRQPVQVNSIPVELASKDFDQMTMTANGVWYADTFGHTNGTQVLSDLLFFIPHSVWPDRATDTGVLIGRAILSPQVNLSAPMWLEFWLDFSWLGLILGFLLYGWISARWDHLFVNLRRRRRLTSPAVLDIAVPIFVGYQFILLRGSILQAMGRLAVMAIFLLAVRGRPLTVEEP